VGFSNGSRTVVIGAHTTTVSPTFDGYATLDFGPVLPRFRVASEQPLDIGVYIDVGDTQATNLNDVIRRDALIASSPDGEIRELRDALLDMAFDHAIRGAAVGFLAALAVAGLWRAIGRSRRAEPARRHRHERPRRPMMATGVIAALAGLAVAAAFIPGSDSPEPAEGPATWVSLPSLFPDESLDPQLNRIEVLAGGASRGGVELIDSAVSTYNDSLVFYRELKEKAAQI